VRSLSGRGSVTCSFFLVAISCFAQAGQADVWSGDSFSADPGTLRRAAEVVKRAKHSDATVLLNDLHFRYDEGGRLSETHHLVYRIENDEGMENWAEVSGEWEAWHQSKPVIRARVIASDDTVHWLDPKTFNDVPVHEDAPALYTDERRFGGPLPAIAVGAIVEEEIVTRDLEPLFKAGSVIRWQLGWSVPANRTHVVIEYPDALPLRYEVHLLPDAKVTTSRGEGFATITLDQGPLNAFVQQPDHVPADVILRPEIEFCTGTSWKVIAGEYSRLTDDRFRKADVEPLVTKLKADTRSALIRRIVASVHKNVRYTGVEFGESSIVPQFPSETLKRKYGDCKDKATLLVAMLRAAGIPAHLALLASGPGRDINPDLPGFGIFDHAIVNVPATGSEPELWIDATAQYTEVGTLPWMDYGRRALIVSADTESLTRTPELTAAQNVHRELRVFTLAEYGNATIAEIDEETGPEQADYRQYYARDSKEVRANADEYVKSMYLADSLTSIEHDDLSDLDKPAAIKLVTKGKRGNTDLNGAVVAIRVESLFENLPKYFRTEDDSSSNQETLGEDSDKTPARTADWRITPFTTEWHYEINAPFGFKLRALPSDKHEKVDSILFTQEYSANSDGTAVKALLRVECPTSRVTVPQGKELRDAVLKVRSSDPIMITFDNVGYSLIAAGKIKEGLAEYRHIASQHPKEALHKIQFAQALLAVGLGEEARVAGREATVLEPDSGLAFSTLGTILKSDLIGRPLKKGMDFEGAVAAYKKAVALDPKDKENSAELGMLLEYDAEGVRYSEKANLKDAVEELRALKKLDEQYSRTYDDNILYDLWYAHDYQAVLDFAATLPTSDVRKGLTLAAVALTQGTDAALKQSLEITTNEQTRSQALVNAAAVLLRIRKYPETAAMFTEAARGQNNASQIARSAAIFANTRPYSDLKVDANDPRGVVMQFFACIFNGNLSFEQAKNLIFLDPLNPDANDEKAFKDMMSSVRRQLQSTQFPLPVIGDLTLSNMKLTVDGDDSLGYKVTVESLGAAPKEIFVIRDGTSYKIVGFSSSEETNPDDLAAVALREIEHNNLVAARKWLDRARDRLHISTGDDPLAGAIFPYFWTKGQETDATALRLAALVLLPSRQLRQPDVAYIRAARDRSKTDLERARLNMVLAYANSAQERWSEMLPLTLELMKAYPSSLRAFSLAVAAYNGLNRLDDWDKLVQTRIHDYPDELTYVRSSAALAIRRGQFDVARAILKGIIDKGEASAVDLNDYSWYALALQKPIDQDSIDMALRANDLSRNAFALQHTLGCLYAQAGRTKEARELLLQAMESLKLEEPNGEVWFGFGLIAEQYGMIGTAQQMFARVEKPKQVYSGSTYSFAQHHLSALGSSMVSPAPKPGS